MISTPFILANFSARIFFACLFRVSIKQKKKTIKTTTCVWFDLCLCISYTLYLIKKKQNKKNSRMVCHIVTTVASRCRSSLARGSVQH